MKIGNKPDLPQAAAAAAKQAPKSATTVATEESTKGLPERAAGVPVSFIVCPRTGQPEPHQHGL
ncbi:hypothetical protein J4711_14995 [Staphylococcus epidermidis]|nr:hypothetical protein [Staphylococcus epidermidis]